MERTYVPRAPVAGVLYDVVCRHLSEFLAAVDARTDGLGLPAFVTKELAKLKPFADDAGGVAIAALRTRVQPDRAALGQGVPPVAILALPPRIAPAATADWAEAD